MSQTYVSQTYRVRFTPDGGGSHWPQPKALTIDLQTELENIPEKLPSHSQILSIENLITGELVHWTRWPREYRPA